MTEDPITRLNAALEGRYRIERELGEGGMATVYLADDIKHERKVALKVLKPELAAVVGAERFLAEIKTTANLQHPHIPMRSQESDHSGARAILPATRLTRLGLVGGAFYLVVALIGLFFVGLFISGGASVPLWFQAASLLGAGGMAAAGTWMIWAALRGAPTRHASWFRHLVSAAAAGLLWAPFELLQEVHAFDGFLVAGAAFLLTESLVRRWLAGDPQVQLDTGAPEKLIDD